MKYPPVLLPILICNLFLQSIPLAFAAEPASSTRFDRMPESRDDRFLANLRLIQKKNADLLETMAIDAQQAKSMLAAAAFDTQPPAVTLTPEALAAALRFEARYTLATQYMDTTSPAYGAFNNVYGDPTWVVPRENALAILGLIEAAETTGNAAYLTRAGLAADYLVRIQDQTDGGWFDQYSFANSVTLSKSPTQTAEVMIALSKLGYTPARAQAMKKGAEFLLSLQKRVNKTGLDDGLICGGKDAAGNYSTWRWASDNSFAYWALKAAEVWSRVGGDNAFANQAAAAVGRIITGINTYLYNSDPLDDDYGVWKRAINASGIEMEPTFHEWINYAPQMLDVPVIGVGSARVGEWIHQKFQQGDGAVVWNDSWHATRKSPGFSFQAALVWYDLGQTDYANAAVNWALGSGLLQKTPDPNGISGGWIDWTEPADQAPNWQRFIDTSFYATAAFKFGYDFEIGTAAADILLANLQGSASMRADFELLFGVRIPATGKITGTARGVLYGITGDPKFISVAVFIPALQKTATLVRGLRANSTRLSDFNQMFGATLGASGPILSSDLEKVFALGGDPKFNNTAFLQTLTKAASLYRVFVSNATYRADFNLLYGTNILPSGTPTAADRTALFNVTGTPGYVQSAYLPALDKTAKLYWAIRPGVYRTDFNRMYGTHLAVSGFPSGADLAVLFSVAGTPGYNMFTYLPVLRSASSLVVQLRLNPSKLASFVLVYGAPLSASGAISASTRTMIFSITGTPGYDQAAFLASLP